MLRRRDVQNKTKGLQRIGSDNIKHKTAKKSCQHANKMEMAHFVATVVLSEEWRRRRGGGELDSNKGTL